MKLFQNFLNNIPLIISALSLFLSWLVFRSNRISLTSYVTCAGEWIDFIILEDGRTIVNDEGTYHFTFVIINTSPHDVGFFDLGFVDPKTRKIDYQFLVQANMNVVNGLSGNRIVAYSKNGMAIQANVPENGYGVFKAHSQTRFDIFSSEEQFPSKIMFGMHVAKKRILGFKEKFSTVVFTLHPDMSHKPNYRKLEEQFETESEQN